MRLKRGMFDRNWDAYVGQQLRSNLGIFVRIWDRSWVYDRNWDQKLAFQLVAKIERYSFKSYYTYLYVNGVRRQNADSTYSLQIPLPICDSTYSLRIPLTFAVSATAQFNFLHVSLFVCGFHKLFWFPHIRLQILQICLFLEQFWTVHCLRYLFAESKTAKKIKENSNFADSATNLVWTCCGIRLQCTEWTVWPRNVLNFFHDAHYKLFLTTKLLANCFSVNVYLEELFVTHDSSFLEILLLKENN